MKRKGSVLIECLIAIVIFLIGMIPVTKFTINSLCMDRRSAKIEEAARITTTIIDYVKSKGYTTIVANASWDTDKYYAESHIIKDGETDTGDLLDSTLTLEGRGIDLEDAEFTISMMETNLELVTEDTYTNPVTNSTASDVIFGTDGLLEDQPVYGTVTLTYQSSKSTEEEIREYSENFILVPMENLN